MCSVNEEEDSNFGGKAVKPEPNKSSMEILSELFSTFDAEPPVIVKKEKKEKDAEAKKSKKSKKKHKHKEKKHKKKSRKRKRSSSASSDSSSSGEIDLAQLLIKQEKDKADEKIKIEGTSLSLDIKLEINKEEQKVKTKLDTRTDKDSKQKIHIKDIQLSSIKKEKVKRVKRVEEEGEITDSESDSRKKKSKHRDKKEKLKKKRHDSRERSRSRERKYEEREKSTRDHRGSERRSRHDSGDKDFYRSECKHRARSRSKDHFYSDKYRDDHRSDYRSKYRHRSSSPFHDDGWHRSRPRSRSRDRFWEKSRDSHDRVPDRKRDRDKDESSSSRIDKKKLLEIARRNAVQMMKSGNLPGALTLGSKAQEKMIAAIKSGGKTVEELTDFCKSLSKKEELGELSSLSEQDDSDAEDGFHHPFKLKEKPTTITMNITNSVPLPTKSAQERTSELRMQFPVSSGQQHRVNEEWVPVSPTSSKSATVPAKPKISQNPATAPLAIEAPPPPPPEPAPSLIVALPNAPPGPQVFPALTEKPSNVDIGSVVSQRLTAMRKLQENPHDVQALGQMYKSNKEMETWAKSKQQLGSLGSFTGSTGAHVLSPAELSSGYQAWAKRDQLQTAAPVSGGMGMHLLQKMGWKPGEGLGKEKTGALEPLLLEVKLDKKGLVATEEQPKSKKKGSKVAQTVKAMQGKHPVSLLGEYASKRKLGAPQYVLDFECGPDHKKNFLFKVVLDGVEYKPNVASANKKEAKANAASLALKQIGLLE